MSAYYAIDKKPHVCPPSNAEHPRDRWESFFVYSFICKFTNLRHKVEGLETPMDFEEAVMSNEPNDILTHVLAHFVLNLKPQTRNLSIDLISSTVQSVLSEFLKTPERTVFWDDTLHANVDPFESTGGGFFSANWDFKLKILRQLVDLQLTHAPSIKAVVDRAWGVVHNKHKKREITPPPEPENPKSRQNLQVQPLGQDSTRKRYWIADDSPRVYTSTNPWKITATFETVCTTREEYVALVERLKETAPPEVLKKNQKRTKPEQAHLDLIKSLESRLEAIDTELARVARVRKRIQQKHALFAQAELRTTRTRRKTQKPDYVYSSGYDSEEDPDEYRYQDDEEDDFSSSRKRKSAAPAPTRRSGRAATMNKSSARETSPADSWKNWRGERRSTRLGAPPEDQIDDGPSYKRARTDDSAMSGNSGDEPPPATNGVTNDVKLKGSGAAALKPTEVAVEQVAGKKKSKFWVYAVEPALDQDMEVDNSTNDNGINGSTTVPNGDNSETTAFSQASTVAASSSPCSSKGHTRSDLPGSEDCDPSVVRDRNLSPIPMDTKA